MSWSDSRSRSTTWEPINPAAPVTSIRIRPPPLPVRTRNLPRNQTAIPIPSEILLRPLPVPGVPEMEHSHGRDQVRCHALLFEQAFDELHVARGDEVELLRVTGFLHHVPGYH